MRVQVPFMDLGAMTRQVRRDVDIAWEAMLGTGDFVGGAAVERFEEQWARYCGTHAAVGVANGTDAITLTLRALGIGPGDEVVVPANTFVATVEGIVLSGARPRFADVDPDTLLLTADGLAAAITPRTCAVIVVHLYGQPANLDALGSVAARAGLVLIEDAAQAHGAAWMGRRTGSFGRAGCFSFYPGKNLGAFGDAGAVVTSDPVLARTLRSLRNHGRQSASHYLHINVGTNSRLDTIQAAVLSAKLLRLDGWTASRRAIVAQYRKALERSPVRFVATAPGAEHVHHLAVSLFPDRDRAAASFARLGVATAVHYPIPCHLLEPYSQFADGRLPIAEAAASQVLSLPLFPHMTEPQIQQVCNALGEVATEAVVTGG